MSYKPQFQTDTTGNWYGNAQAFATKAEAELSAYSRAMVWTAVRDWRAIESDEPVNYMITADNRETYIEPSLFEAAPPKSKTIIDARTGKPVTRETIAERFEHDLQVNAVFDNKDGLTP